MQVQKFHLLFQIRIFDNLLFLVNNFNYCIKKIFLSIIFTRKK